MALKGQPITLGTSDTTVYTCPVSTEASVHGLVIGNNTGSAATFTLKVYIQSTATTTTVATGISVAANSTYTWPKPIDVNAGDIIKIAASALTTLVALYSVYEGSNPPVAVGFTPRGTWTSVANYVTNDVVTRSGSSYLALQASTNQDPVSATSYWMELFQDTGDVTGPASSTDNAIVRFDSTTGKVLQNSAATVADTTGDITAGKYNGLTVSTTTGTLTVTNGKTLSISNTLTFSGTDSSSVAFGTGGTVIYSGGALGTPSSGTLTNCDGLPLTTGITGTLGVANGGTGITSFGTGVATWLGTPSSANLRSAVTDETGIGSLVFADTPTLVTPVLGVASATTINKVTITAPATGSTLTVADGKTLTASNTLTFTGTDSSSVAFGAGGTVAYTANKLSAFAATTSSELAGVISDETGTGVLVFNSSPTLTTPRLSGSSTGYTSFASSNSSATNYTVTFPAETMTVGFRNIPPVGTKSSGAYPLAVGDVGKYVQVTGGTITIPDSVFAEGDVVSIFNNTTGGITLTCSITTAYIAGTNTDKDTMTLATRGVATVLFISSTVCVVSGNVS
jgi:hypothetical protein